MWVSGAKGDRAKIGPLCFRGRVTCLARVGAELLSLNLRWIPSGSEMIRRTDFYLEKMKEYGVD